jgi:deoxyribonuclease V
LILAFDTYYINNAAKTVCIAFESWGNEDAYTIHTETTHDIADYEPGAFYKRELPCIISLLKTVNITNIEAIIVDGFVFLDDNEKLGLGGHLYKALHAHIPIIGVAKTNFAAIEKNKCALLRGNSSKPLYITAVGIDIETAAEHIKNMKGEHRMPTILKKLDTLTKEK